MPSEEAMQTIDGAFAEARATFRSAVTRAIEELRTMIEAHTAPAGDRSVRAAAELGVFAQGRIDMDRFAAITGDAETMDPAALGLLQRAKSTLTAMAEAGDAPFTVKVMRRGDVVADVRASLAMIGRTFGAARTAELVRLGRSAEAQRDDAAGIFPFHRWTRAERRLAPPLVVHVDGEGLHAGGLSAFLDGAQKLVLVVEGVSPPAPLVRLITPGVFVMQTDDPHALKRLAAFDGPGIAAVVGEGGARFVHDPSAGDTLAQRLEVSGVPEPPKRALGHVSPFEQTEELRQLQWLAEVAKAGAADAVARVGGPAGVTAVAAGVAAAGVVATGTPAVLATAGGAGANEGAGSADGAVATPADRLAALLLRQAGLSSVA